MSERRKGAGRRTLAEAWVARALADPWVRNNLDVKELLGHGTFGRVWLVKSAETSLALKAFKPFVEFNRIATEIRLVREHGKGAENCVIAAHSAALSPPDARGLRNAFLLTQHVPFVKFSELLARHLSAQTVLEYVGGLLRALEYLHSRGVCHRDVKPSNFLACPQQHVYRLIDFGLAEEKSLKVVPSEDPRDALPGPSGSGSLSGRKRSALALEQERSQPTPPPGEADGSGRKRPASAIRTALFASPAHGANGHAPNGAPAAEQSQPAEPAKVLNFAQRKAELDRGRRSKAAPPKPAAKEKELCMCFESGQQPCPRCLLRPPLQANQNGTPGFRAPEILLQHRDLGPAVDVWAAGMVALSMVCQTYPLFNPKDTGTALAQQVLLFGSREMSSAARSLRRALATSEPGREALELRALAFRLRLQRQLAEALGPLCGHCERLSAGLAEPLRMCVCKAASQAVAPAAAPADEAQRRREAAWAQGFRDPLPDFSPTFWHLLHHLLRPDPKKRTTATSALKEYLRPLAQRLLDQPLPF